jgi:hypothetical protein
MRYYMVLLSIISVLAPSCKKDSPSTSDTLKANAEIIAFRPEKCGCCWGWVIRMGTDTIKVDSLPHTEAVGYNILTPIPVYIELGGMKQDCSSSPNTDPIVSKSYYTIKKLELVN